MDKIEALYNSYIEQGLLSKSTTLEQFANADESIQQSLYDSGVSNKVLSQQTDFDTFRSAWGEKKNPDQTLPETGGESNLEDTSSESQELSDAQKKAIGIPVEEVNDEFGIPMVDGKSVLDREPVIAPNETSKAFGSGLLRMVGGVVGLPELAAKADYVTKMQMAKWFGGEKVAKQVEEMEAKINALPKEKRTKAILELQAKTNPVGLIFGIDISPVAKWSAKMQNQLTDEREKIDATRKEYEDSIGEDLVNLNIGQASNRIFNGIVESVPMMLGTIGTGGAGLFAVGGSVAADKLEEYEREGLDIDTTTVGASLGRGAAEMVGGKILQGIFKPILGKVSGKVANEITEGVFSRLKQAVSSFGKEFIEESLQAAQEDITDALVKGEDIDWNQVTKNMIDGGLIGGFSTTPSNLISNKQQTGETNPLLEGQSQELNIPAVDENGNPIEYTLESDVSKTPDNQGVVTPENGVFETEQGNVPDTETMSEFDGEIPNAEPLAQDAGRNEVVANGFGLTNKETRDSSMGEGGAVKDTDKNKGLKKFIRRTFSSSQKLPQEVVRATEKHQGRIGVLSNTLLADQKEFGKIIKSTKKNLGKKNLNKGLLAVNDYLSGKESDVSFLSETEVEALDGMREKLDTKSKELVGRLQEQKSRIQEQVVKEQAAIEKLQTAQVEADNPLGLDFDVEFDYKSRNMTGLQNKMTAVDALTATVEGNIGSYMFRSYDAFADTKYLDNLTSKTVNKEGAARLNKAIEFVMEDTDVDKPTAKRQILDYLDGLKSKETFLSAKLDGKMDAPFLKRRKDIPQPIRELLGESKDPVKNYIASVHNIGQYLSSITYQQELGRILTDLGIAKSEIDTGYTQFKTNGQGWDFLEGIYVPTEFAEQMQDFKGLDPLNGGWVSWIVKGAGYAKLGKTVLSPTTAARNMWSGAFLALGAGFSPFSSSKNWSEAIKHSWGTKKTQGELKAENDKIRELGIIGDGAVSGEILQIMNDMDISTAAMTEKTILDKAMGVAQKIYALGDDAYKVVGFYKYKKRYQETGMSDSEAEEAAAQRIRNGFPTYSKLPKNIQALRRFPLIGTFPSFTYEVWRTTNNNIQYVYKDMKRANDARAQGDTKKANAYAKMAMQQATGMVLSVAIPVALGMLSKEMFDISDEEEKTAKNMSPDWQKNSQLVFYGKGDGNVEFIDATAFFPSETFVKPIRILFEEREGREMDDKLAIALKDASNAFLGTDILTGTLSQLHSNKSSYGQEIYRGETLMEGLGNDPTKIADYIATNAGWGVYNNIKEFGRANADVLPDEMVEVFGEKESKYKEYTNLEATLAVLGFRLSKVDYTQGTTNLAMNAREDFIKERTQALIQMKAQRIRDDEAITRVVESEDEYNKQVHEEVLVAMSGYKNAGIPPERLFNSLKAKKFSDKSIAALFAGIEPPLKQIRKTDLKSYVTEVEVGRMRNDKEKVTKVTESMAKNAIAFNKKTAEKNMENMGQWLYNVYGDKLLNADKISLTTLSPEEADMLNLLKQQGMLYENANEGMGNVKVDKYNAYDYYIKLAKKK